MDTSTFSGVADYKPFGPLSDRSPACLALVYAPFLQTDVSPNQAFQCLRTGPSESDFAWVNVTGGAAANSLPVNTARVFGYSNSTPAFTNVVIVNQVSVFGHQLIEATFIGDNTAGNVTFQIADRNTGMTVLVVGPFAFNGLEGCLVFTTAANLAPGNHLWELQAMSDVGTLSAIYATITVTDLSEAA